MKGSYDQYSFFVLPALEPLALLMAAVPLMISRVKLDGAARAGVTVLMVVISNAVLRVVDFARLHGPCDGEEFFRQRKLCQAIYRFRCFENSAIGMPGLDTSR